MFESHIWTFLSKLVYALVPLFVAWANWQLPPLSRSKKRAVRALAFLFGTFLLCYGYVVICLIASAVVAIPVYLVYNWLGLPILGSATISYDNAISLLMFMVLLTASIGTKATEEAPSRKLNMRMMALSMGRAVLALGH
jgi:hypothetical protein